MHGDEPPPLKLRITVLTHAKKMGMNHTAEWDEGCKGLYGKELTANLITFKHKFLFGC